ncbi:MAG: hypothetical protein ACK47B_09245 [Armatimonadota bacterium]
MYSDPLVLALRLARTFDALSVPYLIGGSVATSIYGELRTTQDIDFVALFRESQIPAFVEALRHEFYVHEEMIRSALRHHTCFNVIHLESMDRADVFLPADDARFRQELDRRRAVRLDVNDPGSSVFVASPEDAVLHKLEWYRDGGGVSDRQWRDVLGVLKVQGSSLEIDYLRGWADRLTFRDLLERALGESGVR